MLKQNEISFNAWFEIQSFQKNCLWRSLLMVSCWTQELLRLIFFNGWFKNSFIWNKLALRDRVDDDVMLDSGNCSSCQLVLWTNYFVGLTFRGSNWRPTVWKTDSLWWLIVYCPHLSLIFFMICCFIVYSAHLLLVLFRAYIMSYVCVSDDFVYCVFWDDMVYK